MPSSPRLQVSPGFLLLLALFLFLDREGVALCVLLAWCIHEGAHIAALLCLGQHVKGISLTLDGARIWIGQARPLSYGEELLPVLAGPGVNLLLALVCARLGEGCYLFAGVNLALGAFNLLPVPSLDGGRAVKLVLRLLSE